MCSSLSDLKVSTLLIVMPTTIQFSLMSTCVHLMVCKDQCTLVLDASSVELRFMALTHLVPRITVQDSVVAVSHADARHRLPMLTLRKQWHFEWVILMGTA